MFTALKLSKKKSCSKSQHTIMLLSLVALLPSFTTTTLILSKHFVYSMLFMDKYTRWTNVNLLYVADSIEIASIEGLTLWCPEIN